MREGHDDREGAHDAVVWIGEGVLDRNRRPADVAREAVQAGETGQAHAVGADVLQRAGEPSRRHGEHDNVRLDGAKLVVAELEFVHGSGPEVLHCNVALGDELLREFFRCGLLQVERDAAVASPAGVVLQAAVGVLHAPGEWRQRPVDVDARTRLDLEHLGAKKTEGLSHDRPGPDPAEVCYADALQRQRVRHTSPPVSLDDAIVSESLQFGRVDALQRTEYLVVVLPELRRGPCWSTGALR